MLEYCSNTAEVRVFTTKIPFCPLFFVRSQIRTITKTMRRHNEDYILSIQKKIRFGRCFNCKAEHKSHRELAVLARLVQQTEKMFCTAAAAPAAGTAAVDDAEIFRRITLLLAVAGRHSITAFAAAACESWHLHFINNYRCYFCS